MFKVNFGVSVDHFPAVDSNAAKKQAAAKPTPPRLAVPLTVTEKHPHKPTTKIIPSRKPKKD